MKNRTTLIMTAAVLVGFAVIILINVAALFGIVPAKYISPNDVRGIAVEHQQKLYTLNFNQQNAVVTAFNNLFPITEGELKTRKIDKSPTTQVQKIIIYRFDEPDIEITPVGFIAKSHSLMSTDPADAFSYVFSIPAWHKQGFLEEAATDSLYKILSTTYDP